MHDEVLLGVVQNWIRIDRVRRGKANKCAAVREKLAKLSAREREVLAGVLGGQSNKEMAAKLAISAKSIEVYRGKQPPERDFAVYAAEWDAMDRDIRAAVARGERRLSMHWLGLLRQRPRKQRNVWSHS